mmetsp:Transcript_51023/g.79717  ORF Transcript_51023/g.79717 Transcript_51023/m.79717 type:complete len:662 (-) Transcript_51023:68-2053(-)
MSQPLPYGNSVPSEFSADELHQIQTPSAASGSGGASPAWGSQRVRPRQEHEAMTVELEKEFYTASFVASLHLGQERKLHERLFGECFFVLAMLIVASVQCMTVLGMSAYLVEKEAGYEGESKLATGLFVNGGTTMSMGFTEDMCGSFTSLPLQHFAGHNSLELEDGTRYLGTEAIPVFHTYKLPGGAWAFDSSGGSESYIDKLLRVLRDAKKSTWRDTFAEFRVEYGYLFVAMVSLLWFYVLFELRKIARFMFVGIHLLNQGLVRDFKKTTEVDIDNGKITIKRLNMGALIAGILCVIARATVSTMMLVWGTSLLAATGNKLNLVLNAIAIGIVFELDVVIAYAVIDHNTMARIESIEPIKCTGFRKRSNKWDILFGLLLFLGVFCGAGLVRSWQMNRQTQSLQTAAALCLFAGPAPQAREDLVAPVSGFCESLLSLSCAPSVEGPNVHGPCVVTNQDMFQRQTFASAAEGELFQGMYTANGERRSMADWGSASPELLRSKAWYDDVNLNFFRKACVQLYQPTNNVDMRVVESSTGVKAYSAPFFCPRDKVFEAVFGGASVNFESWSSTLSLQAHDIIAALDSCQDAPVAGGSPKSSLEEAPKASLGEDEEVDATLVSEPASRTPLAIVQQPRAKHLLKHRMHHEVRHYKIEAPARRFRSR